MMRSLFLVALLSLATGDIIIDPPGDGCDEESQQCKLTAGVIDDNLNFVTYEIYKKRAVDSDGQTAPSDFLLPNPDLSDRLEVVVKDQDGEDFSCAVVEVEGQEVVLSAGTDGRLALFSDSQVDNLPARPWTLIPKTPNGETIGASKQVLDLDLIVELVIATAKSEDVNAMDLALVLDTTGSMCDEIQFLQDEFGAVITELPARAGRAIDLRFALVVYRDETDEYVTRSFDFDEPAIALGELADEVCNGGGDYPEAVHNAWQAAAALDWRTGTVARVALLVGDAPPHRDHINDAYLAALELRRKGVAMYGMAASGTDDVLEYLFRLASVLSGGSYTWLTDDSGIGGDKTDAKVACFQVTQMQELLTRLLRGELDGTRYEAADDDIVREVGNQTAGICLIDINDPEASLQNTGNDLSGGFGGGGGGASLDGGGGGGGGSGVGFFCFPGEASVEVQGKGLIPLRNLLVGDMVRDGGDDGKYSKVYSFGHRDPDTLDAEYLKIEAAAGLQLEISKDHMMFVQRDSKVQAVPALAVTKGDLMVLESGNVAPITKISNVVRKGAFAPFTMSGTIVVNGVLASSYVSLQQDSVFTIGDAIRTPVSMQWLAHAFQAPHRMTCQYVSWSVCSEESYTEEGLSYWVHSSMMIAKWVLSQNIWVVAALTPIILLVALVFQVVEVLCVLYSHTACVGVAVGIVTFASYRKQRKAS